MSDPVTNVEIEDVLSSIRRLVSVDSSRKGARNVIPDAVLEPQSSQKLVLTEAFRVEPEPEPAAVQPAGEAGGADYTRSLERRIAELESAVTAQATEFEPDGSEDTSQHRPTTVPFRPAKPNDGAIELDVLCAEDGEAGAEPALLHDGEVQEEAEVEHSAMWSDDPPGQILQDVPDDDVVGVYRLDARDTVAGPSEEDSFPYSGEDTLIDEETLRDMVSEIVRDELQGALGERITRNVRKLVRREIMRAISIRDFD